MKNKVKFKSESTLAQQCYEQLQYEIIEGILKPGEKLKVEPIKQRFGVGQSPIREALSRLTAFGFVASEDNKGFRVASVSEADVRDTYEIFLEIELLALKLAMKKGDDAWQAQIVAALYKLGLLENSTEPISYAMWAERNYNFHVALITGCKSPLLLEIRKNVYLKFERYCRMAYQLTENALSYNHEEHQKIAEAVITRDVKLVKKLMTYHIYTPLEDIIKKLKQNELL